MTSLGGPADLIAAVKQNGGLAGPRSMWAGSWMLKSGYGGLDKFYADCKVAGDKPMVLFWFWGDQISPNAIQNGVQDPYQNLFKTRVQAIAMAGEIALRATKADVAPIIILEPEFNKGGCESSPVFASYYSEVVKVIRAACPHARICFAPGKWGDLKKLATYYVAQIEQSDLIGLQSLNCVTRMSVSTYQAAGASLVAGFQAIRSAGGKAIAMPAIVYDLGYSSYGGPFATVAPFAGGDMRALDNEQANGLTSLAGLLLALNVESVVYRSLRDSPDFNVANYFGWGERGFGVIRADGSPKPGMRALLNMAGKATSGPPAPVPAPTPAAPAPTELETVQAVLAASQVALAASRAEVAASKAAAAALQTKIDQAKVDLA